MQLVRNEHYWRPSRPFLDRLIMRNMPDLVAAAVAVEAGAAHVVRCANNDVRRLNSGDQTTVTVLAGSGNYDFALNCADQPFIDKRVRQAIDLSLDRKTLCRDGDERTDRTDIHHLDEGVPRVGCG